MSYTLDFLPEAYQDLNEAVDWYNEQKEELGERLYHMVTNKMDKLKDNPFLWSVRYNEVHCALVDTFPYLIHYIIEEDRKRVLVLGILHTSKDPQTWKERKKE